MLLGLRNKIIKGKIPINVHNFELLNKNKDKSQHFERYVETLGSKDTTARNAIEEFTNDMVAVQGVDD